MGVVLIIAGLCWAFIGAAHLIGISMMSRANAPSDGMAAFGLLLDMVLFMVPGLIAACVGEVIRRRAKRAKNRAA